jgi:hypothetical protein
VVGATDAHVASLSSPSAPDHLVKPVAATVIAAAFQSQG